MKRIANAQSLPRILKIAKMLKIDEKSITDEHMLLSIDSDVLEILKTEKDEFTFFKKLSQLSTPVSKTNKYKHLVELVQKTMVVFHGNAGVERSFSQSNFIMPTNRTLMSEQVFNSRKLIKFALKFFNNDLEKVPITPKLIKDAKLANQKYEEHLYEIKAAEKEALAITSSKKEDADAVEAGRQTVDVLDKEIAMKKKEINEKERVLETFHDSFKKKISEKNKFDESDTLYLKTLMEITMKMKNELKTLTNQREKYENDKARKISSIFKNYVKKMGQ